MSNNDSPVYCEHANECPYWCPCDSTCYCRQPGRTCDGNCVYCGDSHKSIDCKSLAKAMADKGSTARIELGLDIRPEEPPPGYEDGKIRGLNLDID